MHGVVPAGGGCNVVIDNVYAWENTMLGPVEGLVERNVKVKSKVPVDGWIDGLMLGGIFLVMDID